MKSLILGDLHFGVAQNNEQFLKYQLDYLKTVQDYVLENKIDRVIQLGDTFHNRFSTSNYVLTEVKKYWFEWFNTNKISLVSIMGNHDMYYKNKTTHSPLFNYQSTYIDVVDSIMFDGKNKPYDTVDWSHCYLSYNTNINDIIDMKLDTTNLFGHFDSISGKMNNSKTSDKGYDPKIFKKFKKAYSGHYHSPSELDNIKYIGTPFQLDFNNYNETHGFYVLENDKETFVENTISPKFIHVTVDSKTIQREITSQIETNNADWSDNIAEIKELNIIVSGIDKEDKVFDNYDKATKYISNHYVKLIIRSIPNHIDLAKFESQINVKQRVNLEVVSDRFNIDKMDSTKIGDTKTLVKEYFNQLDYIPEMLTKEKSIDTLFKYYEAIQSNKDTFNILTDELNFEWITFENFLSYQKKERIDFKIGTNRLKGVNGAGKTSSIIESVNFLLYGNSLLGKNKPSIINKDNKKKLLVEGQFKVANDTIRIIRGMKPGRFEIYKNEVLIDQTASTTSYQDILNNIIGMSQKQLQYLLLKNKKIYKPFSTLSAQDKRTFIEKMFNLDIFGEILALIKDDMKVNKVDLDLSWKDIEKWESLIEQQKEHIEELGKKEKLIIDNKIADFGSDLVAIDEDKGYKTIVESLESHIEQSNSLKENKADKIYSSSIEALNDSLKSLKQEGHKVLDKINEQISDVKDEIDKPIEKYFEANNRKIKDLDIEGYKKKELECDNLIKEHDCINELNTNLDKVKSINDKCKIVLGKYLEENIENDKEVTKLEAELSEANKIIETMSSVCGDCIRIPDVQKNYNIKQLNIDIENLHNQINTNNENISNTNNDIESNNLIILKIESEITTIESLGYKSDEYSDKITELEIRKKEYEDSNQQMKDDHQNTIKILNIKLDKLKEEKQTHIDSVSVNIKEKKKEIQDIEDKRIEENKSNESDIKKIEEKIKSIENDKTIYWNNLSSKKEKILESIKELEEKEIVVDDNGKLTKLNKNLRLEKEQYEDKNLDYKYLDFIKKMLMSEDSIKSYIIDQYVEFINYEFNMNLSRFNMPFALVFDKNLNQTFLGSYSDLDYSNLSSGEEKAIDLAMIFTFDTLQEKLFNRKINLVVFDEILSGLDINNFQVAFDILKERSTDKSIWIIEHLFNEDVDRTYEITKTSSGSKITEEK